MLWARAGMECLMLYFGLQCGYPVWAFGGQAGLALLVGLLSTRSGGRRNPPKTFVLANGTVLRGCAAPLINWEVALVEVLECLPNLRPI